MTRSVDVAIIGAGTAGLQAVAEARRTTDSVLLINAGPTGTLCARAGCMPSKTLIQVARDYHRRKCLHLWGITGGDVLRAHVPEVLEHVRSLRDHFVESVRESMESLPDGTLLEGRARFNGPTDLDVEGERVTARAVVIATGSRPVMPGPWRDFGNRIVTTDDIFDRPDLPARMGVVGLGPLGLELGQALGRLGVAITGVESGQNIAGISDPHINDIACALMAQEFPLWMGGHADLESTDPDRPDAPLRMHCGGRSGEVDAVLAAVGRNPNLDGLNLEALGVDLDDKGMPPFDRTTCRIGDLPVFIAGDARGAPDILHEAHDEGRIAGHNAARVAQGAGGVDAFRRRCPMQIVYTEPQIARIGADWTEVEDLDVVAATADFSGSGKALIMGENKGGARLYADRQDGRLLGAALCAPEGEHLAHLLSLAVDRGMTVHDLVLMTTYHPSLEEGLLRALKDLCAKCGGTDVSSVGLPRLE